MSKKVIKQKYSGDFPTLPSCKIGEAAGKMKTLSSQVREKSWYSFGQTHCYQFKDKNKGIIAATLIHDACHNDNVLYDNTTKTKSLSFRKEAQRLNWNAKIISKNVYTACSQFCLAGVMATGINVNDYKNSAGLIEELNTYNNYFNIFTTDAYTSKTSNLYEGDILAKANKHVIMVTQGEHLRYKNTGDEVEKLQKFLNWAGFDCGKVDGIFGIGTKTAVGNFQTVCGMKVDYCFGKVSLANAKSFEKEVKAIYNRELPNTTLRLNSKGIQVQNLQKFLNWYNNSILVVDGIFGRLTELDTKKFQQEEELVVDGIFGPKSIEKANYYTV